MKTRADRGWGRAVLLLAVVLLAHAAATPLPAQERTDALGPLRPGDLIVLGGRLFDATPDAEGTRPNPGILVRNGTILRLGLDQAAFGALPEEAFEQNRVRRLVLDDDQTVLPGFVDLHAHYAVDLFGEGRVDEAEVNPVLFLANGVTSTFPAGEVDPETMRRARLEIDGGLRPGPRIFNSGPYYGSARPGWDPEAVTPDSLREEVRHQASLGAKGFKAKGIGPAHLEALIDQAHELGLPVTAHLDSGARGSVNPAEAIRMGIDRIEHFLGGPLTPPDRSAYASLEVLDLDDPETADAFAATAALYLEHDVFFDATLSAYGYFGRHQEVDPVVYERWTDEMRFLTPYARSVVEERTPRDPLEQFERIYRVKLETVKAFHDAGGADLITLGTDHPSWGEFLNGFSVHREIRALARSGIPAAQVLRIATVNGARALGVGDRLGTVEAGKYADLVVVDGDPIENIRATRRVAWVVRGGEPYDPAELLRSVEGEMGPEGPGDADWWKGRVRLGR